MLKFKILLSLQAIVSLNGFAQGSNKHSTELIPHFKKDEIRRYQIKYTVKYPAQGHDQIFNSTTEEVVIKVVNIQNNLIDFEWTYLKATFIDSVPQYNPIMDLMNTLTRGLTVKYTTDSRGVIKSVTNYEEISSKIKQRVTDVIENMSKDKSIAQSLIESTKFQFEMMFSTTQQIDEIVISDIFKFHELYGKTSTSKSKLLIQATDSPSDKYEIQLASFKDNVYRFNGTLTGHPDNERKGHKAYEFEAPSYWLIRHVSKTEAHMPMPVSQFYEIELTDHK
jgi:hypothetical protein